jgi:hypothetical protein
MSITEEIVENLKSLPPEKQRQVLDFTIRLRVRNQDRDAAIEANDEIRNIGLAGEKLAAKVWPKEDFSDWEKKDGGA